MHCFSPKYPQSIISQIDNRLPITIGIQFWSPRTFHHIVYQSNDCQDICLSFKDSLSRRQIFIPKQEMVWKSAHGKMKLIIEPIKSWQQLSCTAMMLKCNMNLSSPNDLSHIHIYSINKNYNQHLCIQIRCEYKWVKVYGKCP